MLNSFTFWSHFFFRGEKLDHKMKNKRREESKNRAIFRKKEKTCIFSSLKEMTPSSRFIYEPMMHVELVGRDRIKFYDLDVIITFSLLIWYQKAENDFSYSVKRFKIFL